MFPLQPSSQVIDAIPSTGRVWVLVHHYMHLTVVHTSAYQGMVRATREAVGRLLGRNPEARVIVQVGGAVLDYRPGPVIDAFLLTLIPLPKPLMTDRAFLVPANDD